MSSDYEHQRMLEGHREGGLFGQHAFLLLALVMVLAALFDGDALPMQNRIDLLLMAVGAVVLAAGSYLLRVAMERKLAKGREAQAQQSVFPWPSTLDTDPWER